MNKNVTIIVPIYKDWTTLEICLHSLYKNVSKNNQIILINDNGPEADLIEKNIKKFIVNKSIFSYYRNKKNVGFVETCNKGVFEIDKTNNDILLLNSDTQVTPGFLEEMHSVLHLTDKHGVVTPRSNCGTICSIPITKRGKVEPSISYEIYLKIKTLLPRFSVIPTGVGFCMLIKRELINNFGLFKKEYGLGYNEENDFCQRISLYGYSSVMANHAFVYHYESKSFGKRKKKFEIKNHARLLKEYPFYDALIDNYINKNINPIDYFAELLATKKKKKLLISLYSLPPVYNGTTEYAIALVNYFYKHYYKKYEISILINREADRFHKLSKKYGSVFYPDNISGVYDLALVTSQIFHLEHLIILNRVALRYVFTMQDIIVARSNYLISLNPDFIDIFKYSIRYANGIIGISDFSIEDTKLFFSEEFNNRNIPFKKIYQGTNLPSNDISSSDSEIPFLKYILVFGNSFKHKLIEPTLQIIKNDKNNNYVIFGYNKNITYNSQIKCIKSGNISKNYMESLLKHAKCYVFPSVYEGFGLILLDAKKYGIPIIVHDNSLNHEIAENFSIKNIYFYKNLSEIPYILSKVDTRRKDIINQKIRTKDDVAADTESFISDTLDKKIDIKLLNDRWDFYKTIDTNFGRIFYSNSSKQRVLKRIAVRCKSKHSKLYSLIKKTISKFPKLYKFLKNRIYR